MKLTRSDFLVMLLSSAISPILSMDASAGAEQDGAEKYVYGIFYENDDCSAPGAVTLDAFVSEDDHTLFGGKSDRGRCSIESTCVIDRESESCLELERTVEGNTTFSVDSTGLIFQCDTTNTDGECSLLDRCYASSIFPHCHFEVATTSDLVKMAEKIKNSNVEGHDMYNYMLFYADNECKNFEGMEGIVSGGRELSTMDDSVSCRDSLACLYNPEGAACAAAGGPAGISRVIAETENYGRDSIICQDTADGLETVQQDGKCVPHSPNTCLPSPILASCYYRMTTASRFFENPSEYLGEVTAATGVGQDVTATTPLAPVGAPIGPTSSSSNSSALIIVEFRTWSFLGLAVGLLSAFLL